MAEDKHEDVVFVRQTGVDSLAVAIGNSHGAYKFKGQQHLDLDRLKAIKKALMEAGLGDYPLVLHGASSVPIRSRSPNKATKLPTRPRQAVATDHRIRMAG